jgi:AcrR family transcriptional regulator
MAPKSRSTMSAPATRPRRGTRRRSEPGEANSQRRQALLDIAADLFAEQGFRSTTVRQIGDAAGVLSGSLYHHFDSKEAIVDEILSEYFTSLMATYENIVARRDEPAVTLRHLVKAAFNSLDEHRAAITVIQNERGYLNQFPRFAYVAESEAEVRRIWTEVLDNGIASGAFRDDMDTTITYRFIRDSLWVAVRWFTPSGRLSADELAEQYLKLVMSGLEKPNPWASSDRPLFSG